MSNECSSYSRLGYVQLENNGNGKWRASVDNHSKKILSWKIKASIWYYSCKNITYGNNCGKGGVLLAGKTDNYEKSKECL